MYIFPIPLKNMLLQSEYISEEDRDPRTGRTKENPKKIRVLRPRDEPAQSEQEKRGRWEVGGRSSEKKQLTALLCLENCLSCIIRVLGTLFSK